jgi:all-trans-retinol 13,14-reductase
MLHTLTLVQKIELIDKVFFLTFRSEDTVEFVPGQFMSLEVKPKVFRAYSISYVGKTLPPFVEGGSKVYNDSDCFVSFMVSTKPGGEASTYFTNIKVGAQINGVGPAGKFAMLKSDTRNNVFIATGTGLSPFVSMIDNLLREDSKATATVFFGCWRLRDNFAAMFLDDSRVRLIVVAEDLEGTVESENVRMGRVTTVVPDLLETMGNYTFYLCGHPVMVQDMESVLLEKGVDAGQIVTEKFGLLKK